MNSRRMFYLMCGALVVLTLAIFGTAYIANTKLQTTSKKLVELKLKSHVLETEKASLVKAKADIEKYSSLETIAKPIVPQDKDQAQAIREIVKIAADSGIKPSSITFPASTLGTATAPVAAPVTPAEPATGGGTEATPVAPVPVPKPVDTSYLSQLTAVKGLNGVYVLPITITQDASSPVSYAQFVDFLSRLEQNRRTAQVSNIILQPSPVDRNLLSFTITVSEYIKP